MIFNKDAIQGLKEFRKYCPYLSKTEDFENLFIDIDNAEFMLSGIVGQPVLDVAQKYYSNEESGSGYVADVEPEKNSPEWIKHNLVIRIQHAVSYISYRDYVINRDVSHSITGRKSQVDAKNERQAWEFMIERDNDGITSKMHLAINRLLQFLEEHDVKDESGADAYSNPYSVLLNTLELFQQFYPIDDSRLLFFKLLPFQRTEQVKYLVPIVGQERLGDLVEKISGKEKLDDASKGLFEHAGTVLSLRTMAVGIKRLSVKLMPEGLVQRFQSSIQARSASMPVKSTEKDYLILSLLRDAETAERDLADYVAKLEGGEEYDPAGYDTTLPTNSISNKFFTV